jgi:hypothetical protein
MQESIPRKYAPSSGMTLRDYFAAKILINPYFYNEANVGQVAQWAYRMADAMLKQRNKQHDTN